MNEAKSIQLSSQYVSEKQEHEIIIDDENNCCLCGSTLNFKHSVDYMTLRIKEDASCPSCMIQMKSKEHSIQ